MAKAATKMPAKNLTTITVRPAGRKATAAKKPVAPAFTAHVAKEITATFADTVGLTAKVAAALAAENVNILAGTGYSASGMKRKATFTLSADDLVKAEKTLEKIGADYVQDSSVIMVEMANKVGALERISAIIADAGINIYYILRDDQLRQECNLRGQKGG